KPRGCGSPQPFDRARLPGLRWDRAGDSAILDTQLQKARGVAPRLEPVGLVEIVVDNQNDDPVGSVTHHLELDHLEILAEGGAADAETIDLDSLTAVTEGGGEPFAKAVVIGALQRLDITVADDRDAGDARSPCHGIVTNPSIPALGIDPVGRGDLVAHPPDTALVRRVADDAVDKVVRRHVAREADEAEHDELAKREEYRDADQHQANIYGERLQPGADQSGAKRPR